MPELVSFGLITVGGAVGIASFFLTWAGNSGIGIGTMQLPNQVPSTWGWSMPAQIPLFLLTLAVLVAVALSDRLQQQLPRQKEAIGRTFGFLLPMLLAGIYLGVSLMYMTLPWGYGTGVIIFMLAGVAILAGALVAYLFPPTGSKAADVEG